MFITAVLIRKATCFLVRLHFTVLLLRVELDNITPLNRNNRVNVFGVGFGWWEGVPPINILNKIIVEIVFFFSCIVFKNVFYDIPVAHCCGIVGGCVTDASKTALLCLYAFIA